MQALVARLDATGQIASHEITNSLSDKLLLAEEKLAAGDFSTSREALTAFLNEVREHGGQEIAASAADDLRSYANYLRSLFEEID